MTKNSHEHGEAAAPAAASSNQGLSGSFADQSHLFPESEDQAAPPKNAGQLCFFAESPNADVLLRPITGFAVRAGIRRLLDWRRNPCVSKGEGTLNPGGSASGPTWATAGPELEPASPPHQRGCLSKEAGDDVLALQTRGREIPARRSLGAGGEKQRQEADQLRKQKSWTRTRTRSSFEGPAKVSPVLGLSSRP